jgi:hypothetical protein
MPQRALTSLPETLGDVQARILRNMGNDSTVATRIVQSLDHSALISHWKYSRPNLARTQAPRLFMPTTGYSFPDTRSIAFPMFHDVSLNKVE